MVDSTASQGGSSGGDHMSIARAAARAEAPDGTCVVTEEVEHTGGPNYSTVSAHVAGRGPSVSMVDHPRCAEGINRRAVSGDIITYVEWVRIRVRIVAVVGHHRGNFLLCDVFSQNPMLLPTISWSV